MYMQYTLDKYLRKIFLFTTRLLLLVIPCRKATNSAGPGARQSATDSAQLVDQITSLYVSEYRKRDLMAQKLFFELLIPRYLSFKISY